MTGVCTHITLRAEEARLHGCLAVVASVDKGFLALVVQLVEQRHGGKLGPPQGGELVVLLPGGGEEGVTAVHQLTAHSRVRLLNGWQ